MHHIERCPYVPGSDPVKYMREDHAEIREMLGGVCTRLITGDVAGARKLYRQARLDIEQHFVSEEDEVFPLWESRHPRLAAELHGLLGEHPRIRKLVGDLDERLSLGPLERLMGVVDDHARREERLFGIAPDAHEERLVAPRQRAAAAIKLPVVSHAKVYHSGDLRQGYVRRSTGSWEGPGLSVSTHPTAWRNYLKSGTRELAKTYVLRRKDDKKSRFVDMLALDRQPWLDLAVQRGLLSKSPDFRIYVYVPKINQWRPVKTETFTTRAAAEASIRRNNPEGRKTKVEDFTRYEALAPLVSWWLQYFTSAEAVNDPDASVSDNAHGLMGILYLLHQDPALDGAWWDDPLTYDPKDGKSVLSAPRGVIFPHKLSEWKHNEVEVTERLPSSNGPPANLAVGATCDWPSGNKFGVTVKSVSRDGATAQIEAYDPHTGSFKRSVPVSELSNCRTIRAPGGAPTRKVKPPSALSLTVQLEQAVQDAGIEATDIPGQLSMLAWDIGYEGGELPDWILTLGEQHGVDVFHEHAAARKAHGGHAERLSDLDAYPWLAIDQIDPALPLLREHGVSEVARSPRGFLTAYRRANGDRRRMGNTPRSTPNRDPYPWWQRRNEFIARHTAQAQANREPLWHQDGTPTNRHLGLVAWAYTPDPKRWKAWVSRLAHEERLPAAAESCPPSDRSERTMSYSDDPLEKVEDVEAYGLTREHPKWDTYANAGIRLLAKYGIPLGRKLGCGTFACAYEVRDDPSSVAKLTGDPSEAVAWAKAISTVASGGEWPQGLARTHCVKVLPADPDEPDRRLFYIRQERLEPLSPEERKVFVGNIFALRKAAGWTAVGAGLATAREQREARNKLITTFNPLGAGAVASVQVLVDGIAWMKAIGVRTPDLHPDNIMVEVVPVDGSPPRRLYKLIDAGLSSSKSTLVPALSERLEHLTETPQ